MFIILKTYWDMEYMRVSRAMTKPLRALDEVIDSLDKLNDNPSSKKNANEGSSWDGDKVEIRNDVIEIEVDEDFLL